MRRELAQDLNNFGELAELVPVEDFFLNYLETLEDKAGVGGVAGVGGRNAGASAHTNVAPDVQPAPAAVGSGTRAGGPSDQDTFDEEDDENSPGSSGAPQ